MKSLLTYPGGIGPNDQLEIVKSSTDGPTFISNTSWIDVPVGYNLEDHTNVCSLSREVSISYLLDSSANPLYRLTPSFHILTLYSMISMRPMTTRSNLIEFHT